MVSDVYANVTSTATSTLPGLSTDDVLHAEIEPVFLVGRYVYLALFAVGLLGNIASAVIWNTPHMYDVCSSAHYLVTISICDFLCQFLYFFYYLKQFWRVGSMDSSVQCKFWSTLYLIPLYISELLLLGLTVEKLISIRNPFRSGWFSRHQRAPKEIVWIVVSVTAMSLPNAYVAEIDNRNYCKDNRGTAAMQFPIWNWLVDAGIFIVVPVAVLVICWRIIKEAGRSIIGVIPKHRIAHRASINVTKTLRQSTIVILRLSFFRVLTLLPETFIHYMFFLDPFKPSLLPVVLDFNAVNADERWQRYIVLSAVKYCVEMISNLRHAVSIMIFFWSCRHFKREFISRLRYMSRRLYISVRQALLYIRDKIRPAQEETVAYKL